MPPIPFFHALLARVSKLEKRVLIGTVAVVLLVLAFGTLVSEVVEGDTLAFDRQLLMLFRSAQDPGLTVGPTWLREAMRDVTALGGTTVLTIIVLAVTGFLAVTGLRHAAGMVLAASSLFGVGDLTGSA
jgi:undecaprenyl-diphosphatase